MQKAAESLTEVGKIPDYTAMENKWSVWHTKTTTLWKNFV